MTRFLLIDLDGTFDELITKSDLEHAVKTILKRMNTLATQDDVNALSDQIDSVSNDLSNSVAAIQQELDALASANPSLDLSGVTEKVQALDGQVQAVADLKPSTP